MEVAGGVLRPARIQEVRRSGTNVEYLLRLDDGQSLLVGREVLRPSLSPGRWAAVLRHVRLFLPELRDDEVVIFQNIPSLRSVPEVAHAHVFIRPRTTSTRESLRELRRQWRIRSPWAEHD